MTDITIPPAALEAGARALAIAKEGNDEWWTLHMRAARATCLAMIEAWEGMTLHQQDINAQYSYFVLPLPQEASDDK